MLDVRAVRTPLACLLALGAVFACGSGPTTPIAAPTSGAASAPTATSTINTNDLGGMPASAPSAAPAEAVHHDPAQLDPALATAKAPDVFRAKFTTTRGVFVVEVHREWAPHGADRFYNLVKLGFFDDTRFFRVIEGFMAQFGISGDPQVSAMWRTANIEDDPVVKSNTHGWMTFAQTSEKNSRSTQVFINFGDNSRLDQSRFAPFGQIVQGLGVVDALYHGYGEGKPQGNGPDQGRVQESGNRYLDEEFPWLDRVLSTQIQ